jgi:hypothetical protein
VLRRQRAGLASAAAVMIGVKAMATMARVKTVTRIIRLDQR